MKLSTYIGQRVRAARQRAGLTQEELAAALDKSVRTISNIERGDQLTSLDTLEGLASALRQPVGYFFEGFGRDALSNRRAAAEAKLAAMGASLSDADLDLVLDIVHAIERRKSNTVPG